MIIVIATNNENKVREFKSMLDFPDIEFKTLKELNYTKDIIEDGNSFKDNALIKAKTVAVDLGYTTISDDSGLEVEALNNAPGIYSARYAGTHNDEDNNKLLISNLKGIENRNARYVCAICVYKPNGEYRTVEAYCNGKIIDNPRGKNGFGYDPYFYFEQFNATFAEISLENKNKVSHRSKALRMIKELLNEDFSFK